MTRAEDGAVNAVSTQSGACASAGVRRGLAVAAAASLALVAGCSSNDAKSAAPSVSFSDSPSPKSSQEVEKERVLEAYRSMWQARNRTYAKAELDPQLEEYAGNKALSNIKITLMYYQDHDIVTKGKPTNSPEVTRVDTKADPKKAWITDCVDASDYHEVNSKTGKRVEQKNAPTRVVYKATAIASSADKWTIWTSDIDRGAKC
ncbi:hypothetical protein ACTWJ8_40085 (plasmid) [Streptomyces sp. SDT5-1]|uniref:hypothetical protein n=1 Tax=Streptomyces sp. SDT5-1 TaxID=3406418 RepID=UPI003FD682FB